MLFSAITIIAVVVVIVIGNRGLPCLLFVSVLLRKTVVLYSIPVVLGVENTELNNFVNIFLLLASLLLCYFCCFVF